ncbi:MAG: hypothetical protein M3O15_05775 [Acidobacteriota bacterium]|nr:hypothetical protein [Acidobacteriota bacterium]
MAKVTTRPRTAEEFFALAIPEARTAPVRGELLRPSSPGLEHGVIALRTGARLLGFAEANALGVGSRSITYLGARRRVTCYSILYFQLFSSPIHQFTHSPVSQSTHSPIRQFGSIRKAPPRPLAS